MPVTNKHRISDGINNLQTSITCTSVIARGEKKKKIITSPLIFFLKKRTTTEKD